MQRVIDVWHSPSLNRQMEIVTYGHYGFPLLLFPTAAADFLAARSRSTFPACERAFCFFW